jgi:hypothetical protein
MGNFLIGLGIGLFLLVSCIGYLYSNGSTLIWKKKKR